MKKHAYLIMAHNNVEILKTLINLLDDPRNDIYVHVDKRHINDHFKQLIKEPKYSNCILIPSIKVNWGGYSLFNCELNLLKYAIRNNYDYYHLLSGVDLPLYNQDVIHKFFRINEGKEFISIYNDLDENNQDADRWQLFHFLRGHIRRNDSSLRNRILLGIESVSLKIQNKLGIKRFPSIKIIKNANWFSITNNFAKFIIDKEKKIRSMFRFAFHPDEFILSFLLYNSPFKDKIYPRGNMRYVDWSRGDPYIWRSHDYNEIYASGKLFARKFDVSTDMDIVNKIYYKAKIDDKKIELQRENK